MVIGDPVMTARPKEEGCLVKNAVLLYLLVFLWMCGVYDQFKRLCRQRSAASAAAFVFRILLGNYPMAAGVDGTCDKQLTKMAILIKTGELLSLVLLLRIFWLNQWGEAVLLLLILSALVLAFFYLVSLQAGNSQAMQCVYPLSEEYGVYEITLKSGIVRDWVGTTLAELDLRRKELLVLSIVRSGQLIVFPKGPEVLLADDRLLVFGKTATLPVETDGKGQTLKGKEE